MREIIGMPNDTRCPYVQVIEVNSHHQYIQFRCAHWMETQHVFCGTLDEYMADDRAQSIVNATLAKLWDLNHLCGCELPDDIETKACPAVRIDGVPMYA